MTPDTFIAQYLVESPLEPDRVADIMAGEQSSGTFTRVQGETDDLRARTRAVVKDIEVLAQHDAPALPNAWLERKQQAGPWRQFRVRIAFPIANVANNLPTLAATVAGNLYDLGEVTGLRLETLHLPAAYRQQFDMPQVGLAGTRHATGVEERALIGTIIKPNVGLSPAQTAELVRQLCVAGVDFIKDDEICADPVHAPLAERVPAVMAVIREHEQRTGKHVMMAFNVSDEVDAMRAHADLVEREGGSCVMVSLNSCGMSAVQTLRRSTPLALHGHRNGYGAFSRHPLLGISFQAYQTLWRLAGVDHMHVHGLQGKFSQSDAEVIESARDCLAPLAEGLDDAVMPAFSSGQWAGTVAATHAAAGQDVLFMAGGGILAHPDGVAAGVASLRQAWDAASSGVPVADYAPAHPELAAALAFFGKK